MHKFLFPLLLLLLVPASAFAQIDTTSIKTIKGITDKMLEFISFEKDEVKDWDEYRNLFLPSARMTSIRPEAPRLSSQVRSMNIEEFVRYAGPNYPAKGFEEYAIGLDVQEFNGISNVFQSFYCKTPDGSYEKRGINSFQLVFLNERWWIASTMYINETDDIKLPNKYLFKEYQKE